jgi:hypothetical protein
MAIDLTSAQKDSCFRTGDKPDAAFYRDKEADHEKR